MDLQFCKFKFKAPIMDNEYNDHQCRYSNDQDYEE